MSVLEFPCNLIPASVGKPPLQSCNAFLIGFSDLRSFGCFWANTAMIKMTNYLEYNYIFTFFLAFIHFQIFSPNKFPVPFLHVIHQNPMNQPSVNASATIFNKLLQSIEPQFA